MSYSIATLLTRNLHDVFGENNPARRRAAVGEIFTEDCVFYEPSGVYRGRDEIDRVAGALKATHPDFRYQPMAAPEELGNGGRIQWVSGRPGEAPAYAGTGFIIARDGRIAAVYLVRPASADRSMSSPPVEWSDTDDMRARIRWRVALSSCGAGIVDQSDAPTVFCMFSFRMQIIDERPGVRYPDRSSRHGVAISSSCAAGDRISYTAHNDRRLYEAT